MKRFFNPENKVFAAIGTVGDHLILSLLWIVCSLPIVTIGAASAAMCHVSKMLTEGLECRVIRDYFGAFRQHFSVATRLWLAYLAVGLVLAADIYICLGLMAAGLGWANLVLGAFMALALLYGVSLCWVFPYIVRVPSGFLQAVRYSFTVGISKLGYSLLMLAVPVLLGFLTLYAAFLLPFLPGLTALCDTLLIRFALRKYTKKEE